MPDKTKARQQLRNVLAQSLGVDPRIIEAMDVAGTAITNPIDTMRSAFATGQGGNETAERSVLERVGSGLKEAWDPRPALEMLGEVMPSETDPNPFGKLAEFIPLMFRGMQAQSQGEYEKAFSTEDPNERVGRFITGSLPLVGPMVSHAAEKVKEGDVAGGVAEAVGGVVGPFELIRALRGGGALADIKKLADETSAPVPGDLDDWTPPLVQQGTFSPGEIGSVRNPFRKEMSEFVRQMRNQGKSQDEINKALKDQFPGQRPSPRMRGESPRDLGTNERAQGTSPRQTATDPSTLKALQDLIAAAEKAPPHIRKVLESHIAQITENLGMPNIAAPLTVDVEGIRYKIRPKPGQELPPDVLSSVVGPKHVGAAGAPPPATSSAPIPPAAVTGTSHVPTTGVPVSAAPAGPPGGGNVPGPPTGGIGGVPPGGSGVPPLTTSPRPSAGFAQNLLGLPRSLMAGYEMSAPLRQSLVQTLSHPVEVGGPAFRDMFRAAGGEQGYLNVLSDIDARANRALYDASGLAIKDSGLRQIFPSTWAEKIPGVQWSENVFDAFQRSGRARRFDQIVDKIRRERGGVVSEQEAKAAADVVNDLTGYGRLDVGMGKYNLFSLDQSADALANVLFSPRFMAARASTLSPMNYFPRTSKYGNTVAQGEFVKDMAKAGAVSAGAMAGADYLSDDVTVETDPRHPDFADVKTGESRLDITGGRGSLMNRIAQGLTEQEGPYEGEIKHRPLEKTARRVARSFLAPIPGMATDYFLSKEKGKSYTGEDKVRTNFLGEDISLPLKDIPFVPEKYEPLANVPYSRWAAQHMTPMFWSDLIEGYEHQDPAAATALGALGFFGAGTATHDKTYLAMTDTARGRRTAAEQRTKVPTSPARAYETRRPQKTRNRTGVGIR